ncbi:MAG: CpsD/CapB family tyrosine-protein kinase [Solirubrobacteraceae bacterium]
MLRRALVPAVAVALGVALGAVGWLVDGDALPWGAVGLGAGLVVGSAVPVLLGRVRGDRRRLRDGSAAADLTGLPLVAHLHPPSDDDLGRRRAEESHRMLRAALALPGPSSSGPARTVVVTSSAPAEGKTTTTAGLARALARSGRPVVAVEADLRRPALARAFGLEPAHLPARGLATAIADGTDPIDLLVEVEPGLRLLPAGDLPPGAPELLSGPDVVAVLAGLTTLGVTIVVDTAPLLPVADTRELLASRAVGRVVLVVRPGTVRRHEPRDAAALLPDGISAVLAIAGRAATPRAYDRYLRESSAAPRR